MHVHRKLDLAALARRKSFFFFGPRGTGKTFLVKQQLTEKGVYIDLLRSEYYLRLSARPDELEAIIDSYPAQRRRLVVVDEVQKVPALLDEVHRLIEERRITFVLTGSSARKLRRGQANLLAGRAWVANLHPLVAAEIPAFDLSRRLRYGGLPAVYFSAEPDEELNAYVRNYLYEEIQAEGLVRKLPQFSRFLTGAAAAHGQMLNFAQLSSDAGVPASTIREHYQILEDTLIGSFVAPWTKSVKRKAIATAKFYFFDTGVLNTLLDVKHLERSSDLYGRSFESFICAELRAYLDCRRIRDRLCYWRSVSGHEVNFLVGDKVAIEVKASRRVNPRDMKGLVALGEERMIRSYYLVSEDPIEAKHGDVLCVPWRRFLESLWAGDVIR